MSEPATHTPVFVDSAGRRLRWVRAGLWVAVLAAIVYIALAASALLGGPRIDAPFLPQPITADAPPPAQHVEVPASPTTAPAPVATSGTGTTAAAEKPAPAPAAVSTTAPVAPPASAAPAPAPSPTAPGRSGGTGTGTTTDNPGSTHRADPTGRPVRP
ncbi:hypothetical protein ACUOFU_15660 [Microbacterium arabinogalactanolyticum]|uniref:hypothetical protein n=1 Tax=Microbacterium arabinogalactanolyticum TaxID=69365 RepID=UPI0040447DC5